MAFFILVIMSYTSTEELYRIFSSHPKISKDTREIETGCIYFALKGDSFDGNKFAKNAIEKGAAFAVIDDVSKKEGSKYILVEDCLLALQQLANYHRNKLDIPILAISGSNGKTTTKELVSSVLSKKYNTLFTSGNYNNHIGVPLTLLRLNATHEVAVIEMGANHQGEIDFLCKIANPTHGLLTNIGKAHLEGFGGFEGVKKGKSELYRYLESKNASTFINSDDEILIELSPKENKVDYGKNLNAYCKGTLDNTHPNLNGRWNCNDVNGVINSKLYGEYNFYNILAAICIGHFFEVEKVQIEEAINNYESDMNRSQIVKIEDYKIYLDAYNANPTSMKLAIENFEKTSDGKKIAILGDMFELGEEALEEHQKIVTQIANTNSITQTILIGKHFFKHQFDSGKIIFFESTPEAKVWFQELDKSNTSFLLKGSRGMKIESIMQKKAGE